MLFAFLLQLHPARDMTYLLECLSGEGAPHKKTSLQVMRKSAIQTHRKRRTVCFNATVQKDTRGTDYLMNPSTWLSFQPFCAACLFADVHEVVWLVFSDSDTGHSWVTAALSKPSELN